MYCFSGVVVLVVSGDVNFCRVFAFRNFSETIRSRAMKLGSCIHLELPSILSLDLHFKVH